MSPGLKRFWRCDVSIRTLLVVGTVSLMLIMGSAVAQPRGGRPGGFHPGFHPGFRPGFHPGFHPGFRRDFDHGGPRFFFGFGGFLPPVAPYAYGYPYYRYPYYPPYPYSYPYPYYGYPYGY